MKETGVSCKVPSVGPGKENRRFLLKRPKVSDGFQGRVLLLVVKEFCWASDDLTQTEQVQAWPVNHNNRGLGGHSA